MCRHLDIECPRTSFCLGGAEFQTLGGIEMMAVAFEGFTLKHFATCSVPIGPLWGSSEARSAYLATPL